MDLVQRACSSWKWVVAAGLVGSARAMPQVKPGVPASLSVNPGDRVDLTDVQEWFTHPDGTLLNITVIESPPFLNITSLRPSVWTATLSSSVANSNAFYVHGDLGFQTDGQRLRSLNISDWANPVPIDLLSPVSPDMISASAQLGSLLLVGDTGRDLTVWDMSRASPISQLGIVRAGDPPRGFLPDSRIGGAWLRLPTSIQAVNLTDPSLPQLGSSFGEGAGGSGDSTMAHGPGSLLLSVSSNGLSAFNATDPDNVGLIRSRGSANLGVGTFDQFAYACGGSGGIRIYDLTDPANLPEVGSISGGYVQCTTSGPFLFALGGSHYFRIWDLSDPLNPVRLVNQALPVAHYYVSFQSTRFVVSGRDGSRFYKFSVMDLAGTPGLPDRGNHTLRVRAWDGVDSLEHNVTLEVRNLAPFVRTSVGRQLARVGHPFSLTLDVNALFGDPENDTLTVEATGMPTWMGYTQRNSRFDGTPDQAGTTRVVLSAIDPFDARVQSFFDIDVVGAVGATSGSAEPPVAESSSGTDSTSSNDLLLLLILVPVGAVVLVVGAGGVVYLLRRKGSDSESETSEDHNYGSVAAGDNNYGSVKDGGADVLDPRVQELQEQGYANRPDALLLDENSQYGSAREAREE